MNKHYREALIQATIENLQEVHGIENPNVDTLNEILDDPEQWEETDDYSFEGDVECLSDLYFDNLKEEEEEVPEEKGFDFEEMIDSLHVGVNLVPGMGIAVAKDEEDLKAMKEYLRGWLQVHNFLARLFEQV